MRNAYLIVAHHHFEQLVRMMKLLDDKNNDFYIHINKNVEMQGGVFFSSIHKSNIFFVERENTVWASTNWLRVVLRMLETAIRNGPYDYYHNLSGDDLPLKSKEYINTFLIQHQYAQHPSLATNYISVIETDEEIRLDRIRLRHYFQQQKLMQTVMWGRVYRHVDWIAITLQKMFKYDRFKNTGLNYHYKGSGFWSISHEFATYVVEKRDLIRRLFLRQTIIPDEEMMQILIMNSPFKDSLYKPVGRMAQNLREIVWENIPADHPKTFTIDDKEFLLTSPNLFARKFNCVVDAGIIDLIIDSTNSCH